MSTPTATRERLLDAALALIAADGVQAVSHRAVEERAGVARGSTRYHFGSRDHLLASVVEHLALRDHALVREASARLEHPGPAHPGAQQESLAHMARLLMADREGTLARFELYLYAARRPELAEVYTRWTRTFTDLGAAELRRAGAPHPERGAELLTATMNGLALRALTSVEEPPGDLGPQLYAVAAAASGLARTADATA